MTRKFYVRISSIVCIFIRRNTRTKSIRSKSVVVESNAARIRATKISLQLDGITKKKRIFTYVNSIVRPRHRVPAPVHRKISGNGHSFHSRDEFAAVRALAKDSPTSRPENRLETRTDRVFHISLRKPRTFTDVTRKRLAVFPCCFSRLISLHFLKEILAEHTNRLEIFMHSRGIWKSKIVRNMEKYLKSWSNILPEFHFFNYICKNTNLHKYS